MISAGRDGAAPLRTRRLLPELSHRLDALAGIVVAGRSGSRHIGLSAR